MGAEDFFISAAQKEKWLENMRKLDVHADINGQGPAGLRNWQRGKVVRASVAEVESGLKVVERYHQQIEEYEARGRASTGRT